MLVSWVLQQVIGFGLIWWGIDGISDVDSLLDAIYFSGVVFFTVGFGEVIPIDIVSRFGALIEAFAGVLTIALVIGYLPALYSAYSEREQKLLTLFRSQQEGQNWITALGLVIDSALHVELTEGGQARSAYWALRRTYDAQLEFLIDRLQAPRGFWGHRIGHVHDECRLMPVDG